MQHLIDALIDGPRPSTPVVDEAVEAGFSRRTMERARAKLKCVGIRPGRLRETLGEEAYAKLADEERNMWWVALPPIPDAPPGWLA
jgi:hypothetical protein